MHDKLSKMQCKIENPTCFKITWHDSREFHDTAAFTSRRHGLVRKPPTIFFSTNSTNLDRTTASELFDPKFSAVLDVKNSPTCSLLIMDHLNNLKFKVVWPRPYQPHPLHGPWTKGSIMIGSRCMPEWARDFTGRFPVEKRHNSAKRRQTVKNIPGL